MIESTQLNLDVHVKYDILPADGDLPTQIDITAVYVLLATDKPNKSRKVNVLNALSESEIINLEDEIHDRVF
jgi:hypothetical protein